MIATALSTLMNSKSAFLWRIFTVSARSGVKPFHCSRYYSSCCSKWLTFHVCILCCTYNESLLWLSCGDPAISPHSQYVSLVQWTNPLLPITRDLGSKPLGGYLCDTWILLLALSRYKAYINLRNFLFLNKENGQMSLSPNVWIINYYIATISYFYVHAVLHLQMTLRYF